MKHLKSINSTNENVKKAGVYLDSSLGDYTDDDLKDIEELLVELKEDGFQIRVFVPVKLIQKNPFTRQVAPPKKIEKYIEINIFYKNNINMNLTSVELNSDNLLDNISSKLDRDAQSVNLYSEQIKEIVPRLISMGYRIKKFYLNRSQEGTNTVIEISS